MRECVAQLFGIVVSQLPTDQFEKSIADLLKSLKDKQVEYQVWSLEIFQFLFFKIAHILSVKTLRLLAFHDL